MKIFQTDVDPDEPATLSVNLLTTGKVSFDNELTNPVVTITSAKDGDASSRADGSPELAMDPNGEELQDGIPAYWIKQLVSGCIDGATYEIKFECDSDNEAFPHPVERIQFKCRVNRD